LELSVYEDIPHLKAPVVTVARKARGVLWWAVEEMERRYRAMKQMGVRDLEMYNRAVATRVGDTAGANKKKKKEAVIRLEEKDVVATGSPYEGLDRSADFRNALDGIDGDLEQLPRIVIVVDELADLMLTVGREIEELLTRLAQKARASGIHLILATQRPSVNVITGLIKANFPARISFKVASKIDARTVMDTSGAEKLLGQGDMLFMSPGIGRVQRLHSPYVSDKEVHDVVDWLKGQASPDYDEDIERMIARADDADGSSGGSSGGAGAEDYDQFYDQAVQLVLEKGQASTSMVQRAFRIGYNRAARILETMEREGIVGPADGAKPRPVIGGRPDDLL
ncbi:MAG: cell division protein FtsK, partial [Bdellovibrionales bacterium]|nr:cell division protein FtsK [Bdellovibrionales bacterium]